MARKFYIDSCIFYFILVWFGLFSDVDLYWFFPAVYPWIWMNKQFIVKEEEEYM